MLSHCCFVRSYYLVPNPQQRTEHAKYTPSDDLLRIHGGPPDISYPCRGVDVLPAAFLQRRPFVKCRLRLFKVRAVAGCGDLEPFHEPHFVDLNTFTEAASAEDIGTRKQDTATNRTRDATRPTIALYVCPGRKESLAASQRRTGAMRGAASNVASPFCDATFEYFGAASLNVLGA